MKSDQARWLFALLNVLSMAVLSQQLLSAAPLLSINYSAPSGVTCSMNGVLGSIFLQSSSGPLNASISCSGPNGFSVAAMAMANYRELEMEATMHGNNQFSLSTSVVDAIKISSPDKPDGTPLLVKAPLQETGGFTFSGSLVTVRPDVSATFAGTTIVSDSFGAVFDACNISPCTGSGNLNRTLTGAPLTLIVGQTYNFAMGFDVLLLNVNNSGLIDFGDPSIPYFCGDGPKHGCTSFRRLVHRCLGHCLQREPGS
jgi:hypothetical protein